jgi:hypothetical protein
MWMGISAGAVIAGPMLLLMTGLPVFTWFSVLAVVALAGTALGAWSSGKRPAKRSDERSSER